MNSNSTPYRRPGAFSPRAPSSPNHIQARPQSADTSASDSSASSSQPATFSPDRHASPFPQQAPFARPLLGQVPSSNASSTSVNNFSRPQLPQVVAERDFPSRKGSPLIGSDAKGHRRQHSQGFFEPSLPSLPSANSDSAAMAKLTASQIAAQAAMQHQQTLSQHIRKRSQTVPSPQSPPEHPTGRRKPTPNPIQVVGDASRRSGGGGQYSNGSVGGSKEAATTAASVAYPKSAPLSPGLTTFGDAQPEKEHKLQTQRSKMKLFSKPKQIGISSAKDVDQKDKPMPSPNKMGPSGSSTLSKLVNPSVTSFADSIASVAPSIYQNANPSTSTLIPSERQTEKEKKHHFLARQKNKFKDRIDDHNLTLASLSSASSNSRPLDPAAPQPLYSFAPASPGPGTTSFSKSVSGLDLRHGGRALREKKREEKASALPTTFERRQDADRSDWAPSAQLGASTPSGQPGSLGEGYFPQPTLQGFGISNMSADDGWDFLKAKLLIVFEGEELRMPVEDLNKLVLVNIQRCIVNRIPTIIIEDLRDLLQSGFKALHRDLTNVPDHRLVPHLVERWLFVFGTVLPYMQAVFLPLDLEFKGHGPLMTPSEAAEFWGANPDSTNDAFGNEFDVRRIVLLSYRDNVILPHHDALKATFSRLSLDSINPSVSLVNESPDPSASGRPGTAASLDPGLSSFNSQGSTLLGDGTRSRGNSNLSAPELPPFSALSAISSSGSRGQRPGGSFNNNNNNNNNSRERERDSAKVTETVGRMLQCVSVLASVQSGGEGQEMMEELARELKLNWLGRGRTGRNRRGFVGTRIRDVNLSGGGGKGREGGSVL
ncbi:MAG: hypothetical protein Q9190_006056 [Brigantiaea leucoxantha]